MYELKKMERYLRVNLLGPGPRLVKKEFTGPRSSQRLRNTALGSSDYLASNDITITGKESEIMCRETEMG